MEKWDLYNSNGEKTGKVITRGDTMHPGEYHILVLGVVKNKKGECLTTRRSPDIKFPGMWEFPGGAAKQGETNREAVIREIYEEVGIRVNGSELNCRIQGKCDEDKYPYLYYVYVIEKDVDINDIVLQPSETVGAAYKSVDEISGMIRERRFMSGIFKNINLLNKLGEPGTESDAVFASDVGD